MPDILPEISSATYFLASWRICATNQNDFAQSRQGAKEDHAASNSPLIGTDLARPSSFLLESQILRRRQLSRTSLFKQLF